MGQRMIQSTLNGYIIRKSQRTGDATRKLTFFHLPFSVRRRIYKYAGIGDGRVIFLNYVLPVDPDEEAIITQVCDLSHWETFPQHEDRSDLSEYSQSVSRILDWPIPHPNIILDRRCPCLEDYEQSTSEWLPWEDCDTISSQLLYVSPRVATEVASLFYADNLFSICRTDFGGLSGLDTFGRRELRWITSLSIDLDFSLCPRGIPLCQGQSSLQGENTRRSSMFPCYREGTMGVKVLDPVSGIREWERFCNHLARNIAPNQLRLLVMAHVESLVAAEEVADPLLKIPVLRECAIRFSTHCIRNLMLLAETTVAQATSSQVHFRFLDLPLEIQVMILRYTELVTPYDVAWSPDGCGPYRMHYFELRALSSYLALGRERQAYKYNCCGLCSSSIDPNCYCWTRVSAASTTCSCWKIPGIMYVSRSLRELALSVFYSKNHFVVIPELYPQHPLRLGLLHFFKTLPRIGRSHLRSITWVLPPTGVISLPTDDKQFQNWKEFVNLCAVERIPPHLTVTLDMSITRQLAQTSLGHPFNNAVKNLMEISSARLMAESMNKYDTWKNQFVHLSWPTQVADFF